MTTTDYRQIVAALQAVPGVADADVQPDGEGGLGLLRLGLLPGVDEVAVATSVGRLLRERFGVGVDADRVQLVEDAEVVLDEHLAGAGPAQSPDAAAVARAGVRLAIRRMQLTSSGLEMVARVTLSSADREETGESTGAATQSGVQRAVAGATLRAVEALAGGQVRFELDHVEVTPMGSERTVVVAVTLLSAQGSERLTGAAAVREDVRQAVIRAALDAVNRRAERFLG